jgi:hypothetical protein
MTEPNTPQRGNEALERLRTLARLCTPAARQGLAAVLDQPPGAPRSCLPLAVLVDRGRGRGLERSITLGYSEWELARVLTEALDARPPAHALLLIDLASGEEREARTMVYFAENALVLPASVGDVITLDLADRVRDTERDPQRERDLETARQLIADGEPVPAAHFTVIIDVLEVDLETRRKDPQRDLDTERELAAAQRQMITREPWRDLPCNTPAAENAGCDRCGSHDRAPRSRYCTHCLAEGYVVYVDGVIETGYLHDTPYDARDEAQLVSESAPGETVEIRGPNGFRETFPPHEPRSQ